MLENLPIIGTGIPLPGEIGDIIGWMKKITGKLHDVQIGMIYRLVLEMQGAIESASHAASLDAIRRKASPVYPIWAPVPTDDAGDDDEPFANYEQEDVIQGDLKKISALDKINQGVQKGVGAYNDALNDATEAPLDVIDFLSKPVEPAPGSPFLADAFGVKPDTKGSLASGEALGKVGLTAFGEAVGNGDMPGFMSGFVGTFISEVFGICVEFLRGVYGKLCSIPPWETVSTDEIVAAGRQHLLFQLIDFALEKTGIDKLLDKLKFPIPTPPFPPPPGASWPTDTLSADPIVAELKGLLSEKLGPYLDPVVEYAMDGLARRLNATRSWASPTAMTMEAHLAQLPTEIALMFRNLFGPLWEFLTDTLMGLIEKAVSEVMGPLGDAVGVGNTVLQDVQDKIADVENKVKQAQAYAKNIEDKAKDLMDKASDIQASLTDTSDIKDVKDAADALVDAVDKDPFADGGSNDNDDDDDDGGEFPSNRKPKAKGKKIEKAELDEVKANHKWDEAKAGQKESADQEAQSDADEQQSAAEGST